MPLLYGLPIVYRMLLLISIAGVSIGITGALITDSVLWIRFYDNLHWTFATILAAVLAWQGVLLARQRAESEKPWRWFSFGLAVYAFAQIVWAIQVYVNVTPFPGPSDLFFMMLGPAVAIGIYQYGRPLFSLTKWRIVLLDASLVFIAILIATMMSYLPVQGGYSWLQLSIMVAYPAGFWAAFSLGLIMMLAMRARFQLRELLLFFAIIGHIGLWNQWNLRVFSNELIDGSFLNILFSLFAVLLGLGTALWRPKSKQDVRWHCFCESFLGMLPLFMVVFSAVGIVLSVTFLSVNHEARAIAITGSLIVVILAMVRQSLMLRERDQLLAVQEENHRGRALLQTIIDTAPIRVFWKDRNSRFLGCNYAFAEDAGMAQPSALIGKDDFQLAWKKEAAHYQADDRVVMETGVPIIS